jgi:hypothetical protein
MAMGQLIRVTTKGRTGQTFHYIVAESDIEKATAIVGTTVPVGARIESAGSVSEALLKTLKLAPREFVEV